jgi:hypothetical protein
VEGLLKIKGEKLTWPGLEFSANGR